MASDLEKLYPQKLTEAKNLYPLAKQYFTGPGSLAPGETLTPEMVKSRIRLNQFYKLRRLLGLAIDAGYDLSYMAEFGLIKQEQGYFIDFSTHPQWASMSSLFFEIREPSDLISAEYYLAKKGLTEIDLMILREYLAKNNPKVSEAIAAQDSLSSSSNLIKDSYIAGNNSLSSRHNTKAVLRVHEHLKMSKFESWNKWGISLLNQFSNQKQRILLDYLQNQLGSMAIGSAPIDEEYLLRFGDEIVSGEALKELDKSLAMIQGSINKEYGQ
jgi:hypothetical protein